MKDDKDSQQNYNAIWFTATFNFQTDCSLDTH